MPFLSEIVRVIKYLVGTSLLASLVYMVWIHHGFVDDFLIYMMYGLYSMILLPWLHLCFTSSCWLFPKLKSKVMNVLFITSILLNMLPAVFVYFNMCDQAASWKKNGWNGGHLDSEMEAFVFLGIAAGLVYWTLKYALYIFLLHQDNKK